MIVNFGFSWHWKSVLLLRACRALDRIGQGVPQDRREVRTVAGGDLHRDFDPELQRHALTRFSLSVS